MAKTAEGKQAEVRKILFFVRHGQYEPNEFGGTLTTLGRKQASRLAQRLSEWPITTIRSSDTSRAVETAQIIAEHMGEIRVRKSPVLREMVPTAVPGMVIPLKYRAQGKDNLDTILKRYFRLSQTTRHEVIVCHGNLIRSLVCRVLGVRLTAWQKMGTANAGITCFVLHSDGNVDLSRYNDVGHLPAHMITAN